MDRLDELASELAPHINPVHPGGGQNAQQIDRRDLRRRITQLHEGVQAFEIEAKVGLSVYEE